MLVSDSCCTGTDMDGIVSQQMDNVPTTPSSPTPRSTRLRGRASRPPPTSPSLSKAIQQPSGDLDSEVCTHLFICSSCISCCCNHKLTLMPGVPLMVTSSDTPPMSHKGQCSGHKVSLPHLPACWHVFLFPFGSASPSSSVAMTAYVDRVGI